MGLLEDGEEKEGLQRLGPRMAPPFTGSVSWHLVWFLACHLRSFPGLSFTDECPVVTSTRACNPQDQTQSLVSAWGHSPPVLLLTVGALDGVSLAVRVPLAKRGGTLGDSQAGLSPCHLAWSLQGLGCFQICFHFQFLLLLNHSGPQRTNCCPQPTSDSSQPQLFAVC